LHNLINGSKKKHPAAQQECSNRANMTAVAG